MTRAELARRLRNAGIDDPEWEARLLFARVTGKSHAALLADPALDCADPALASLAARRKDRYPLQYLLGTVDFYRETYLVEPGVLIPRSDTERLVDLAISRIPRDTRFADLCTGTGCVAVSVLANRPDLRAAAYDVNPKAVKLTEENARRNGVADRLTVFCADLLREEPDGLFSVIVSNPPYIPNGVIPSLSPEVRREPREALAGGDDGMDFYRSFVSRFRARLAPGGFFLFEIGYDEGDAICAVAEANGLCAEIFRDIEDRPRCALLG